MYMIENNNGQMINTIRRTENRSMLIQLHFSIALELLFIRGDCLSRSEDNHGYFLSSCMNLLQIKLLVSKIR